MSRPPTEDPVALRQPAVARFFGGVMARQMASSFRAVRLAKPGLPDLPPAVVTERNIMARNLMMHTCADFERAFAEGADMPRTTWNSAASGLIDAIVGLWQAPITEHPTS